MQATLSTISLIDRLFPATLTFCLLAGGTLAIGSAWFEGKRPALSQARTTTAPRVVQLPPVEVTGKRADRGLAWARPDNAAPTISFVGDAPAAESARRGEHPAIIARRVIEAQGYDYAAKFYPHPAWLYLSAEAPRPMMDHPAVIAFRRAEQERLAALEAAAATLAKR